MADILIAQFWTIGAPVLIALLACSVVALTITIVKVVQFSRLGIGRHEVANRAVQAWRRGERADAVKIVERDRSALSDVVYAAMARLHEVPSAPKRAQQAAVLLATQTLETSGRHLRVLDTIVQAAPMLGLLGTVLGMIGAFGEVSRGGGAADPAALADGIWIALSTTAFGLTVAIPFYFLSSWFEGRVERERAAMEIAIAQVTDVT
ncbi:MAG TPA: MotA/TolQ/ExbB proton channel family protein [Devosiaceae bacterium]|nr:MotA/TolQ/ExbB proton channel family protein [Devosiaceae bacterium]